MRRREEPVSTEIDPGRKYSGRDLDAIATQLLRDDSKTELCRECGHSGKKTGTTKSEVQDITDEAGVPLVVIFSEYVCPDDHFWYEGEGKKKGVRGENPILFEEHEQSRRRREIYCTEGTPDPNIVSGLYHRTHPQGRKVNTPEQRRKHGASFYRAATTLPLLLFLPHTWPVLTLILSIGLVYKVCAYIRTKGQARSLYAPIQLDSRES